MSDLLRLSLLDLVTHLHQKQVSPVELMSITLDRIDATHDTLNAVVSRRERDELLEDARTSEDRIQRGEARPLEGIPLGVKDLEDVAGMTTSFASVPFRNNLAATDSTQVGRLRAAGAIVVAKTNTPEFGFTAITKNMLFGDTRSPWNPTLSPGGSSGGSAALLAGCVLPLVTGSDGGGSIRIPASFVGAFGLKPSYGRVPKGPSTRWDWAANAAFGPLTKTVEDGAFFLDIVAGHSEDDPASLPDPPFSYLQEVRRPLTEKLRIAYSPDLGYAAVQSDIASAVRDAALALADLGHELTTIEGGPPQLGGEWSSIMYLDLAGVLAPFLPEQEDTITRFLMNGIRETRGIEPMAWDEMRRKRALLNQWTADLFRDYDLLLTPTVSFDPPPSRGPFPTEIEGKEQPPAAAGALTIPFNMSWNPAATVRVGLSKAGLPVGMQIVGPRLRDDLVLRAARAFEQVRPWHPDWPSDYA